MMKISSLALLAITTIFMTACQSNLTENEISKESMLTDDLAQEKPVTLNTENVSNVLIYDAPKYTENQDTYYVFPQARTEGEIDIRDNCLVVVTNNSSVKALAYPFDVENPSKFQFKWLEDGTGYTFDDGKEQKIFKFGEHYVFGGGSRINEAVKYHIYNDSFKNKSKLDEGNLGAVNKCVNFDVFQTY